MFQKECRPIFFKFHLVRKGISRLYVALTKEEEENDPKTRLHSALMWQTYGILKKMFLSSYVH